MITCSSCNHQNPEGSVQCESCYTPLPSPSPCPNCGALVQANAIFCGQCGFNLQAKQDGSTQNQSNNLAVENPKSDLFLEEDLIPTSINKNTFNSPWDAPEEEIENLSEIDDRQITFDEFMQLTSDESDPDLNEAEIEPTFGQNHDLSDEVGESEDLESWISSLQEESEQHQKQTATESSQELIEEIPADFSISDELNFAVDSFSSQEDVPEITTPEFAQTEPTVEMPTEGIPANTSVPTMEAKQEKIESEEIESFVNESNIIYESEIKDFNVSDAQIKNRAEEEREIVNPPLNQTSEKNTEQNSNKLAKSASTSTSRDQKLSDSAQTRLQLQKTVLYHLQTKTEIEVPPNLSLIRIGKPNQQVPPDIDVSDFPNAEVVSRVHAHIRVEGDTYFLEDMGSSNGTYVNHSPLPTGNRYRLRSGDRFSLGKGELITFIFQLEGSI